MTTPTPTPNELPTVLGVGSSLPAEAIEAAARAAHQARWPGMSWDDDHQISDRGRDRYRREATDALTAAAPFIAAQTLRDAADYAVQHIAVWEGRSTLTNVTTEEAYEDTAEWLRARATIEGEKP